MTTHTEKPAGLIVFIPGYQDTAALWDSVIVRLQLPGWQSRAINLRHVEGADPSRRGSVLEGYRDQILDLIDDIALPALCPLVVIGHSMGAQVAELVATNRPTTGMALIAPIPLSGYALDPQQYAGFETAARRRDLSTVTAARRALLVNDVPQVLRALTMATLSTPPATALQALGAWPAGHPLGDIQSAIEAPVLLVDGEDTLSSTELIRHKIAPRFTDAHFAHVPGAGHWPQVEQPDHVAEILTHFVGGLVHPAVRANTQYPQHI